MGNSVVTITVANLLTERERELLQAALDVVKVPGTEALAFASLRIKLLGESLDPCPPAPVSSEVSDSTPDELATGDPHDS